MPSAESPRPVRTTTRAVLVLGILSGLSALVVVPLTAPQQVMLASDVYLHAAESLLAGDGIYGTAPPDRPGYHYLYPPVVVVAFLPYALLGGSLTAFAIQTALNVAASVGTALLIYRALSRRGIAVERVDIALISTFVLCSAYAAVPLLNGQVTHWLAFAFAVGFEALDRKRGALAGAAFAAAALIKVFPAVIGLWLLRRRSWSAVGAATATGLGGLLLGALLFGPELTATYFSEVLFGRYEGSTFDGRPAPTANPGGIQRNLAGLFGVGQPWLTVLSVAVLAPIIGYCYRDISTDARLQAAALGTLVATLLFFPLQPLYFLLLVFPLLVLLYGLPSDRARSVLVVGMLASFVHVDFEISASVVEALWLPAAVETVAIGAAEAFYTVVLLPTVGLWFMLAACVLVARERQGSLGAS